MDYKEYFKKNKAKISDREFISIKLGGMITSARLHTRLSQAELAKKIGTHQPSLARAESGEIVPSVEFLYKIAKALKTEFIFPKWGFMFEREKTLFYSSEIGNIALISPYNCELNIQNTYTLNEKKDF